MPELTPEEIIRNTIAAANRTTLAADTDLTMAVKRLRDGYGQSGARVIDHGEKAAHVYHAITEWVMDPAYADCPPSFDSGIYIVMQTDGAGGYLDPRETSYAAHALIVYLTRTVKLDGTDAEVNYMTSATYTQNNGYGTTNFDVDHEAYADYVEMAAETPGTSTSTSATVKRRQTDPEGTYHIWEVELP